MESQNLPLEALVAQLEPGSLRDYLTGRVLPQMERYRTAGLRHRRRYYGCTVSTIILGGLIPLFSVCSDQGLWVRLILAALGSAITGINAYSAMARPKELWVSARQVTEALTATVYGYLTQSDPFGPQLTQLQRERLLVDRCQELFHSELTHWVSVHARESV